MTPLRANPRWSFVLLVGVTLFVATRVTINGTPQGAPGQGPPAPGGRGAPGFPAQQRPPGDPAVVERGKQVYGISCRACHGADLRGGDLGGPNLLRSPVMLNDANGERLLPIIRGGRADAGMPGIDLTADDVTAVANYIHSVLASARSQGAPPEGASLSLNVLVGDAAAGEGYYKATCASCHSTTGDLQGLATRVPDPMQLQNLWVGGGRRAGGAARGAAPEDDAPPSRRAVTTATVTPASGPPVHRRLDRIDDFTVTLILADGTRRTFRRVGDVPEIQINDPLAAHKALLERYTDADMHNVTAFLMTVK
jgi:cytochrome c oxidase cbb3-type subunit 3